MARYGIPGVGREHVDLMGRRWAERCLVEDGSLLFDDRSFWTVDALLELQERLEQPSDSDESRFGTRLASQLSDASDDVRWLAGEAIAVYAMPAFRIMKAPKKAELVRRALGHLDPTSAPHWPELRAAFEQGYGHPGARYNARRDLQLAYLLDFSLRMKRLTVEDRGKTLDDPWRLEAFADAGDPGLRVQMRHVLLHLLRPDDFERVFSGEHKRQIVEAFADEVQAAGGQLREDRDQRLFDIRHYLEAQREPGSRPVDFYEGPYSQQWRDARPDPEDDTDDQDEGPRWFWVNQGKTWTAERDDGILWAPLRSKNGMMLHHWERMTDVRPGDWIVHYSAAIRAISHVTAAAVHATKPDSLSGGEWEQEGRLVRAEYRTLQQPIPLSEIPMEWRAGGPFTSVGSVQQGYLFPLSRGFVEFLQATFDEFREAIGGGVIPPPPREPSLAEINASFVEAVQESGLLIASERVQGVLAALVAKPFVILAGLSGSGKTQLALRLGEWLSAPNRPRSLVVPVRPDWTGPESLFGYEDALRPPAPDGRRAWHVPASLAFMLDAVCHAQDPYLLLLDEMNLAHVERYFSDFLSGVESGEPVLPNLERMDGAWHVRTDEPAEVALPTNLFVIGTVNVDETTYLFSPKVLDRAFTFEVRTQTDELLEELAKPTPALPADPAVVRGFARIAKDPSWHLEHPHPARAELAAALKRLHAALSLTGDEFGHRVFYEALRFAACLSGAGNGDSDDALDLIVLLKVLPRIHGSRRRVEPVLRRLTRFTENPSASAQELESEEPSSADIRLRATRAKLDRMSRTLLANQFVSFSE
ncbi:McrB family protein [Solirubrobacter soli]|uniref:McrB family protein n=1 Tax=Solirubrobacter soli TaxID=363832 RepID=UPI00040396CA|nr:hypothetical protein [Solirubrobacter soli]